MATHQADTRSGDRCTCRQDRVYGQRSHQGSPEATVGIIVYSDFECPYCGAFAREVQPSLDQGYFATGRVLFAFKHLPLFKIHKNAVAAATAAECASRSGKFWQAHDTFFANQGQLSPSFIRALPASLGLDSSWKICTQAAENPTVAANIKEADDLRIDSTPLFLIGRLRDGRAIQVAAVIRGSQPTAEFAKVIDKLRKK